MEDDSEPVVLPETQDGSGLENDSTTLPQEPAGETLPSQSSDTEGTVETLAPSLTASPAHTSSRADAPVAQEPPEPRQEPPAAHADPEHQVAQDVDGEGEYVVFKGHRVNVRA